MAEIRAVSLVNHNRTTTSRSDWDVLSEHMWTYHDTHHEGVSFSRCVACDELWLIVGELGRLPLYVRKAVAAAVTG